MWLFFFLIRFEYVSHDWQQINPRVNPFPFFFFASQERFAEIFGQDAAAEGRRSQESFKKWLLAGMTLVTGVVVGSLIAQKRL